MGGCNVHSVILSLIVDALRKEIEHVGKTSVSPSTLQEILASISSEVLLPKIYEVTKQLNSMGRRKFSEKELREMAVESYRGLQELYRKDYEKLDEEGKEGAKHLGEMGFADLYNDYIKPTKETEGRKIQEAYERFKHLNEVYGKQS